MCTIDIGRRIYQRSACWAAVMCKTAELGRLGGLSNELSGNVPSKFPMRSVIRKLIGKTLLNFRRNGL